jgi:trimeric autotransporter adhesin
MDQQEPLDSFALCGIIVHDIINDIVDRSAAILYDKFLRAKEPAFIVDRTLLDAARLLEWQIPRIDGPTHLLDASRPTAGLVTTNASVPGRGAWLAEEEPEPVPIDSWARAAVPTRASASRVKMSEPAAHPQPIARQGSMRMSRPAASLAGGDRAGSEITGARPRSAKTAQGAAANIAAPASAAVHVPPLTAAAPSTSASSSSSVSPRRPAVSSASADLSPPPQAAPAAGGAAAAKSDAAEQTGKRDDSNRAALRGLKPSQPFTVDERGQLLLVAPPAASRLPPTVVPVSAEVPSQDGPAAAASGSGAAPKQGAAATLSAPQAQQPLAGVPRKGARSVVGTGESAAAGAAGAMLSRFYRENTSTQPALAATLADGVVPGVAVVENGATTAGPDVPPDPKRMTRAAFQQRSHDTLEASQKAARAQQRRAIASRQSAAAAAAAAATSPAATTPGAHWLGRDGGPGSPGGGRSALTASLVASSLAVQSLNAIPDTVQQPISVLATPLPRAQPRMGGVQTHHAAVRSAAEAAAPHVAAELESSPTRLDVVEAHFNRPHGNALQPPAAQPQRPLELLSPPHATSPTSGSSVAAAMSGASASKRPRDKLLAQPLASPGFHHQRHSLAPHMPTAAGAGASKDAAVTSTSSPRAMGAVQDWGETAQRRAPGVIKLAEPE